MTDSLKDQVLDAVDIVEVVGERVALKRRGAHFVGLCPFHDDHNPSMTVNPARRIFKCWSCGTGGDVIKFVQLSQRIEFKDALALLAKRAGIEVRRNPGERANQEAKEQLRSVLNWARTYFRQNLEHPQLGNQAREYLQRRAITPETSEKLQLGLALEDWGDLQRSASRAGIAEPLLQQAGLTGVGKSGKPYDYFRDRLMFPICDPQGRVIAFGGRTLGDDERKYLNSPESPLFNKSQTLFGLDTARDSVTKSRELIVVEGYVDSILLQQAGVVNAVATLGTALTDSHLRLITKIADRVFLCFDGDEAGLRAADRGLETVFRHRIETKVVVIDGDEDPADLVARGGADAFKSFLHSAIGALEFKWQRTLRASQAAGGRGRREAVEAFVRFIASATAGGRLDPVDEGMLVGRVSGLLNLPSQAVYELLARLRTSPRRESNSDASELDSGAGSEIAAYDEAVAALPAGLIVATEELFGHVLAAPETFGELESPLAVAANHCGVWRRFFDVMSRCLEEGDLSRIAVVDACEDSALCDLAGRAVARVRENSDAESRARACDRLAGELDRIRSSALVERVLDQQQQETDRDSAFRSLVDLARKRHGVLPLGSGM